MYILSLQIDSPLKEGRAAEGVVFTPNRDNVVGATRWDAKRWEDVDVVEREDTGDRSAWDTWEAFNDQFMYFFRAIIHTMTDLSRCFSLSKMLRLMIT